MKLSKDQLVQYLEVMNEKAKKALENDFNIHGYMVYQCEECNSIYVMWLAEGLEDPTDDVKNGKHKPVPFGIVCPCCGGIAFHKFWGVGKLTLGKHHRSYKEYVSQQNKLIYENFFWNDPEEDRGTPIILSPDYPTVDSGKTYKIIERILITTMHEFIEEEKVPFSIEIVDDFPLQNRQNRRHPNQHDGYKRPRSNKKLYEY